MSAARPIAFALLLAACGTNPPTKPPPAVAQTAPQRPQTPPQPTPPQQPLEPTSAAARDDLRAAIAEMRNLPTPLEGEEAQRRGPRIQKAWQTLVAAKAEGAAALLTEARQLDATGERDDRFRLGAGAVLWEIGGLDRVDDILASWSDADFAVKYSYAFTVAGRAAQTKDPRAVPLLTALLRDQRGEFHLSQHAMTLAWPGTHLVLWAPLGRDAAPALTKVLAAPPDPTTAASCAYLLASCWHVEALPQLRTLARTGAGPLRCEAVRSVGRFGHPDDYEWLLAGIASDDGELAAAHVGAVAAFGDLRAVPQLLAVAKHTDDRLRAMAMRALIALPTREGIDEVLARLETSYAPESEEVGARLWQFFGGEFDPENYSTQSVDERQRRVEHQRAKASEAVRPQQGDRRLSHQELQDLLAAIASDGRMPDSFSWVTARHLLAAATAADVALLLDARGGLYRRFSDEQLEAIEHFELALRWIVRAQYRTDPGVCEQVQRPAAGGGAR